MRNSGTSETEMIFYDGHCDLCHRMVRFVLANDPSGEAFRFAPLDSTAFQTAVPEAERTGLPDSIVVKTADRALLVRSVAVIHILRRLGGVWRLLAAIARVIPRAARDRLYDWIARIRHRLFHRPSEICPVVPEHLRSRFEF
jgi:predicted DCC family thiol-disulfide oxidoreductase YuxK